MIDGDTMWKRRDWVLFSAFQSRVLASHGWNIDLKDLSNLIAIWDLEIEITSFFTYNWLD